MRHIQLRFVLLIAGLTIFYNFEQVATSIGMRGSELPAPAFTKALITLAVLVILATPPVTRWTLTLVVITGGIFYVAGHLFFLRQAPLLTDLNFNAMIAELAFLVLLSVLAHWVAVALAEFKESVTYLTLEGAGERLPKVAGAQAQIQAEMSRSRYFQRPLSVIAVEFDAADLEKSVDRLVADMQVQLAGRYAQVKLVNEMREKLRLIDLVMETGVDGSFLVLCPEADQESVSVLAGRVCAVLDAAQVPAHCATATFPDEGLTFKALVTEAQTRLRRPQDVTTIDPDTLETANEIGRL